MGIRKVGFIDSFESDQMAGTCVERTLHKTLQPVPPLFEVQACASKVAGCELAGWILELEVQRINDSIQHVDKSRT